MISGASFSSARGCSWRRTIDVNGLARLAPALQGQTADEAKLPALALANHLQLGGGSNNFIFLVPTLCVGMQATDALRPWADDAER